MSGPDMSSEFAEALELLRRMATALDKIAGTEKPVKRITKNEERAALAVVAVAKGASSFAEIARELDISRTTASRNPGIRRALETVVKDRSGGMAEEDYQWNQ